MRSTKFESTAMPFTRTAIRMKIAPNMYQIIVSGTSKCPAKIKVPIPKKEAKILNAVLTLIL
jgi:hypothetical protein